MKIQDILLEDQFDTVRSQGTYKGNLKPNYNKRRYELERGTQSAVKQDKTDPHMVKKYNFRPYAKGDKRRAADGFSVYINYLIDNKLMGINPHLPRVYNVKRIEDADEKHIYTYTVEKLIEPLAISIEEFEAFVNNTFEVESNDIIKRELSYTDKDDKWLENAFKNVLGEIDEFIENKKDINLVKSESLIHAINIIRQADKDLPNVQLDLHLWNYMWRRTQHGIVLVFNDPFF